MEESPLDGGGTLISSSAYRNEEEGRNLSRGSGSSSGSKKRRHSRRRCRRRVISSTYLSCGSNVSGQLGQLGGGTLPRPKKSGQEEEGGTRGTGESRYSFTPLAFGREYGVVKERGDERGRSVDRGGGRIAGHRQQASSSSSDYAKGQNEEGKDYHSSSSSALSPPRPRGTEKSMGESSCGSTSILPVDIRKLEISDSSSSRENNDDGEDEGGELSSSESSSHDCGGCATTTSGHEVRVVGTRDTKTTRKERSKARRQRLKRACAISLACGSAHTMCCTSDGALYSWGSNSHGQLGLPLTNHPAEKGDPYLVKDSKKAAAAGEEHSGPEEQAVMPFHTPKPTQVDFPFRDTTLSTSLSSSLGRSVSVRNVACGSFHTLVVTSLGHLYSFGCNDFGQLGLGDVRDRHSPTIVRSFAQRQRRRNEDSSASHDSSGTTASGGGGAEDSSATEQQHQHCTKKLRPRIVAVGAAGGLSHSLVLTLDGDVYSFGRGAEGQLGDGKSGSRGRRGKEVPEEGRLGRCSSSDSSIVDVAGAFEMEEEEGGLGVLQSSSEESLASSSVEEEEEEGDKVFMNVQHKAHCSLVPVKVRGVLESNPVVMLACSQGGHGSYAVTAVDGNGWRWGIIDAGHKGSCGQPQSSSCLSGTIALHPVALPLPLGMGLPAQAGSLSGDASPASATSLKHDRVIDISAGRRHVVCVTRAGEAWAMGGAGAHLGLGPGCQFDWMQVPGKVLLPGDVLINGVSCGENHTLLSTTSGKLYACGSSSDGKLGLGIPSSESGVGDHRKGVDATRSDVHGIPKSVPLKLETEGKKLSSVGRKGPLSGPAKYPDHGFRSITIGGFTVACETVVQHLRKKHEEAKRRAASLEKQERDRIALGYDSFEDDEDYWGEDGLGYELEMDFACAGPPFGGNTPSSWNFRVGELSSSLKARISSETRRRLGSSTRAVGDVLLSSSAKLSGMVSAVKGNMQAGGVTSGTVSSSHGRNPGDATVGDAARATTDVGEDSHKDSFDGLAGKPRRRMMMAAGCSHSCVHIVDDSDGD